MDKYRHEVEDFMKEFFTFKNKDSKEEIEEEKTSSIEIFDKMLKEFYSTTHMELKSDIKENQVIPITLALMYAKKFGSEILEYTVQYILEVSVSKGRKGRIEFADIFKFATEKSVMEDDRYRGFKSLMGNLM